MDKFYNFRENDDEKTVELIIEGEILPYKSSSDSYLEDEYGEMSTGAKQFADELDNYKDKETIKILINSVGGDVFSAISIYNKLKRTGKNIEVEITGYACSSATIIMMAGNKISMPNNSLIMIHDPMLSLCGLYNIQELGERGKVLEKVKDVIINSYKTRVNIDDKQLSKLMTSETWLTAEECLKYGFIDEILNKKEEIKESSSVEFTNKMLYNKDKIQEIFNKNVKKIKEVFKIQENQDKDVKNYFERRQLTMEEREEITQKERERIQNIYKYKEKIEENLINEAIENGWEVTKLTFEAFERDMIKKDSTLFENHLKANQDSGIKNIKIETNKEKMEELTDIQGILNFMNGIK